MTKKNIKSDGVVLFELWQRWHNKPGGKWLFNRFISWKIPYSGSIKPQVQELSAGHCRIFLKNRRSNTNHLKSIHALALANLGELSSGLAMICGLPPNVRGIVTEINTEYLKKAKGDLTAKADVAVPKEVTDRLEHRVKAEIFDEQGDMVSCTNVKWLLAPRK